MGAYKILILFSVAVATSSLPLFTRVEREAAIELNDDARSLIREHLALLLSGRTNSDQVQVVAKMDVVHVEIYGHGYKVDVNARLSDTNCSRNDLHSSVECLPTNENEQECAATITMVQPQGGRKWFRLDSYHCEPLTN